MIPAERPQAGGDRARRRARRSDVRQGTRVRRLPGDFEKDHAFSFGAWVKVAEAGA